MHPDLYHIVVEHVLLEVDTKHGFVHRSCTIPELDSSDWIQSVFEQVPSNPDPETMTCDVTIR